MIIEEGMYVRTKKGIAKITNLDDLDNVAWTDQKGIFFGIQRPSGMLHFELDDDGYLIGVPSYNIIDLIEVGDYVNGYKIDYINLNCESPFLRSNQPYRVDNTLYRTLIEKGKNYNQPLHFYEEDIKSIVTKEQMEAIKYEMK